jgi:glycosyltransferase involved in cell wall biosynthesis
VQLGAVPYDVLHHLYAACDIYVTPAYAESFAHPLLEAMFSGLPVVASDLPVHREICRDAAVYFAPNCPQELAERVGEVAASSEMRCMMKEKGRQRAATFSWRNHVQELIAFAETLV